MHALRLVPCLGVAMMSLACGHEGDKKVDASLEDTIDAAPVFADSAVGVACADALANYSGNLVDPGATDDGDALTFIGSLDDGAAPDKLRLILGTGASQALGSFTLPAPGLTVSLCLNDSDDSCATALSAYEGTLRIEGVTDRLKAGLDRVIFVDDLTTPTCSASLTQASIDVAILGPT